MPNYCNNFATITHEDPEQIEKMATALREHRVLNTFVPVPLCLLDDKVSEQDALNMTGYADTYQFCKANWGTKWDLMSASYSIVDENTITAWFDTAWTPPIEAYRAIEELGFSIDAQYYEGGGGFCGFYSNGSDCEFSTEDFNDIPDEIVDTFGIEEYDDEADDSEETNQEPEVPSPILAVSMQQQLGNNS